MATFCDSIADSRIQNSIKSLWWRFFAKIVNNVQLLTGFGKNSHPKYQTVFTKKKLLFCILLHNFILFYKVAPYVSFTLLRWIKFLVVVLGSLFFHLGPKKVVNGHVRQVVILHSNNCTGICLGRFSIGCLRGVVIL